MSTTLKLSTIAAAIVALTACNSSSEPEDTGNQENGRTVSANLEATQALLDQARADWQAANLQSYVYQHFNGPLQCEDDSIDDDSLPSTHVVVDGEPQFVYGPWKRIQAGEASYTYDDARGYEHVHDFLQRRLDDEPEFLGRNAQDTESLPLFNERGEVIEWLSSEYVDGLDCTTPSRTEFMHELDELNYDIVETTNALESNLQTWLDAGVQDYTVEARFISGTCEAPQLSDVATVVVVDGEVSEVEEPVDDNFYVIGTIEFMLFDAMAHTLTAGARVLQAGIDDTSAVEFEPNFGFPLSTYAESIYRDGEEEVCITRGVVVEDFR